jgi:hypothetical protein
MIKTLSELGFVGFYDLRIALNIEQGISNLSEPLILTDLID